jgi:hypothetical protein
LKLALPQKNGHVWSKVKWIAASLLIDPKWNERRYLMR